MQRLTLLALLLILLFPAVGGAAAGGDYCTLLLYHRVDETAHPSTSISVGAFRDQMAWIADHHLRVIPLAELTAALARGAPPPPKSVVITFDDTYRSIYAIAAPILAARGYPYTLFVYTEAMEARFPDFMSWEQLAELARRPGVSLGNHGHRHRHLYGDPTWETHLRDDLTAAAHLLQARLGITPIPFAAPYGEYTLGSEEVARHLGYPVQLTQDRGNVGAETPLGRLPRNPMVGSLGSVAALAEAVAQPPLPWVERHPDVGLLGGRTVGEIAIRLRAPEQYRPDQVNLFLSERGRLDAHFDPATGWLRARVELPLTRPTNRITASAQRKADHRWAVTSWRVAAP
ncbi:MAG: polysaccharide deacetylase family protein [Deltaproteobacteria bacterium]|nr:polysaccharide deacetylase family protein [Deltaproteobacteria bacterium]OIP65032.1 MAG: hypothetical protein AUK30_05315 [Nitrospirae bacterium CG2_30_70_394]PIU78652.1 MAG: hypothetical protein COS73_06560 [Nitrospirae bacterium CG06_land_8_20_14_3_00_70_43]PIW83628.1 MAG: hypothetical protein COZ96_02345 [Nitrospirae bacterium CG_4_8_14_3_um_filter_70_85]PIX82743.1 MAG: hypothetical protein COZ33_09105 [Nitrospirae bacterium CG_4_10_14_3_um_filter_70_108]HBB41885.1 hypothetical protein [